jgi:carbamoylphosphate synthase large subunit
MRLAFIHVTLFDAYFERQSFREYLLIILDLNKNSIKEDNKADDKKYSMDITTEDIQLII